MSNYLLWAGLTLFVAFPPIAIVWGLSLAGILMLIGFILLLFKK